MKRAPLGTKTYKTPNVLVYHLYFWNEKEDIVGDLIHGLKGGTPKEIFKMLSRELCRLRAEPNAVIVPVPSSKVGAKDHAYILAKYISEELNLPFWSGLEWVDKNTNQKFLSKSERFINQMKKTKKLPRKSKIILIDDLVTTGATAMAAQKVIKGPNPIEVWSLACRI